MMRRVVLFFAAGILVWGCQSKTPMEPPMPSTQPMASFQPRQAGARIQAAEGRYPNLFAPSSHALWITPEVAARKRAAEMDDGKTIDSALDATAQLVGDRYYVFECRMESIFEDTSIAYDAVGLRGMEIYLTTPQGYNVAPIQRIIGSHADETNVGALRRFGRTNILVFSRRDVLSGGPTISKEATSVRLAFQGQNSTFYFEWANAEGVAAEPEASHLEKAYDYTKTGFSELYSKLRVLSHVFD